MWKLRWLQWTRAGSYSSQGICLFLLDTEFFRWKHDLNWYKTYSHTVALSIMHSNKCNLTVLLHLFPILNEQKSVRNAAIHRKNNWWKHTVIFITNKICTAKTSINGCPLLRVCVHGVCVFTAVCVHFGWVKCRAQILSMGYHTWSYVTSLSLCLSFFFSFLISVLDGIIYICGSYFSSLLHSSLIKDKFTPELKFPDNLLTPMSSKMFMSFFLQSKIN